MLPILISLGPVKIYSYGVFLAIGLFIGLYFWWKMGRDEHWDEIALFDGYFLSMITFLVAGRVGYVAMHMSEVGTLYRSLALLAYPGINVTVGVVAVIVFMILFARAQEWHEWRVGDAMVVSLSIILAIGAFGGLLNGSNPGLAVPWGVMYPGESVARIPVDLWAMIWGLLTFGVVSKVRKNFRFYAWYKGESSMAQEGLSALIFTGCVGIYYLVAAMIDESIWKLGFLPSEVIVGLALIAVSGYLIYQRIGRRDTTVWGKFMSIIRRN